MERCVEIPVGALLSDIDITSGPATLSVADRKPVELEIPVDLVLGHLNIRIDG